MSPKLKTAIAMLFVVAVLYAIYGLLASVWTFVLLILIAAGLVWIAKLLYSFFSGPSVEE